MKKKKTLLFESVFGTCHKADNFKNQYSLNFLEYYVILKPLFEGSLVLWYTMQMRLVKANKRGKLIDRLKNCE